MWYNVLLLYSGMMRIYIFIIVLLAGVFRTNSQLLWKISGEGIKTSYVFGTHHAAPISICDSIVGFEEAFNNCTIVYGEIAAYDMQDMAKDMIPYIMLPPDSLLDVVYSAEDYKILDNVLKRNLGTGASQLNNMKPVAIQSQLEIFLCMRIFKDYNPNEILDAVIQKRAKERGKAVKGLETLSYQAKIIYGTSIRKQASDLMLMIKDFDKFEKYSTILCDAYMNQDLDTLLEIMRDTEFGSTDGEMELLIYNRNRNWVEQLKDVIPYSPVFIAVGAGHLPGEHGLINLLRKSGFNVTPV